MPERGATLGRYVLLERVGEGGMGVVHAAWDPQLDRKVAIKLLTRDAHSDVHRHQRLRREAQTMARLRHPNVATIYDLGEVEGHVYVAMEFVDGPNLRQWLGAAPRSTADIMARFLAAGQGLFAAHRAGIVHRDFKPDNVVVTADERVLVLDFGLARWLAPARTPSAPLDASSDSSDAVSSDPASLDVDEARRVAAPGGELDEPHPTFLEPDVSSSLALDEYLTIPGTVLGTPAYMAPEQHQGRAVDDRCDQYAFCVALWMALHGRHPFGNGTRGHARARAGKLREATRRDVPPAITRALAKGLAWEPSARWPNMGALLDALDRQPHRRRLGLLAVLGVVAALALGVGLGRVREPVVAAPSCPDSRVHVAKVWNEAGADALARRFVGVASERAWPRVRGSIDAWVEVWTAAHTEVCEAHLVRHESSDALHDRQMACLDRQLGSLADLLELLEGLDDDEQLAGVDATLALPRVELCLDRDRMLDRPAPGDSPQRETLERRLERLAMLVALGRRGEVESEAREIASQARELGEHDLRARALLELALVLDSQNEGEAAEAAALEAVTIAIVEPDLELRARALASLAYVLTTRNEHDAAERWLALALVLGEQVDDDVLTRDLAFMEARHALMLSQLERAELANARALEHERPRRRNPLHEAEIVQQRALIRLARGHTEAALRDYDQVAAVLGEATNGTHPTLPTILFDRAVAHEDDGRLVEAERGFAEAHARAHELLGPRDPWTILARARRAKVRGMLGECEAARAELDSLMPEARELLREPSSRLLHVLQWRAGVCGWSTSSALSLGEEILRLTEAAVGPKHPSTAFAHIQIGLALLWHGERELERAREELERGLAGLPDPTTQADVRPRLRRWWALGSTALGIVELRMGEREAGLAHIEQSAGELRDAVIIDLAARERGD